MDCSWFDDNIATKLDSKFYKCSGNHTRPAVPRVPSTPTGAAGQEQPRSSSPGNFGSDSPRGLTTGAKAGIGVGTAAGGLALIGIGA